MLMQSRVCSCSGKNNWKVPKTPKALSTLCSLWVICSECGRENTFFFLYIYLKVLCLSSWYFCPLPSTLARCLVLNLQGGWLSLARLLAKLLFQSWWRRSQAGSKSKTQHTHMFYKSLKIIKIIWNAPWEQSEFCCVLKGPVCHFFFSLIYQFILWESKQLCHVCSSWSRSHWRSGERATLSSERAGPALHHKKSVGVRTNVFWRRVKLFVPFSGTWLQLLGESLAAADAEDRRELKEEQNWGRNASRRMSAQPLADLNIFPEVHNLTEGNSYLRNKGRRTFFVKRLLPL